MQNNSDPLSVLNQTLRPAPFHSPQHNTPIAILDQPPPRQQQSQIINYNNNRNNGVLNGRWKKIPEKSELDMYDRALDLLKLPSLFKNAATQIDVVVMSQTEHGLSQGFATIVPIKQFQVTEKYAYDKEVAMNRRDYKPGKQFAKLRQIEENMFEVDIRWNEPNQGGVIEEFWVNEEEQNELNIRSTVTVGKTTISTLQVYRRIS
eukprot:TRINITY_DN3560_c2_g3_i1.p3 TRINITY_DN3560_c2_g3~~TRINITY_DN3560_c2_g3_i1.p3  ORF type:complete len:224 (+),score=34.92 TRINITY_DN3560_c2_g3_i1:60-674(+)